MEQILILCYICIFLPTGKSWTPRLPAQESWTRTLYSFKLCNAIIFVPDEQMTMAEDVVASQNADTG